MPSYVCLATDFQTTHHRSSMSFLHLMQWHSEWIKRLNQWENEKRLPFIVVANKVDLLERQQLSTEVKLSNGKGHRSVLGLKDGFKGEELKYEYAAENNTAYATRGALTYSLKETLWSNDAQYLNALQRAEDELPANRQLILLWCQRNGIPHVEASALNGRGVSEAMNHLIDLGVKELLIRQTENAVEMKKDHKKMVHDTENGVEALPQKRALKEKQKTYLAENASRNITSIEENDKDTGHENLNEDGKGTSSVDPSQYYFLYQPRQEEKLDLFARYSPKEEERCSPFKCWLSFFSYCQQ